MIHTLWRVLAGIVIATMAVSGLTCIAAGLTLRRSNRADAIQDADEFACALTQPDDPLEQAWLLPAYSPRTTKDTR